MRLCQFVCASHMTSRSASHRDCAPETGSPVPVAVVIRDGGARLEGGTAPRNPA